MSNIFFSYQFSEKVTNFLKKGPNRGSCPYMHPGQIRDMGYHLYGHFWLARYVISRNDISCSAIGITYSAIDVTYFAIDITYSATDVINSANDVTHLAILNWLNK